MPITGALPHPSKRPTQTLHRRRSQTATRRLGKITFIRSHRSSNLQDCGSSVASSSPLRAQRTLEISASKQSAQFWQRGKGQKKSRLTPSRKPIFLRKPIKAQPKIDIDVDPFIPPVSSPQAGLTTAVTSSTSHGTDWTSLASGESRTDDQNLPAAPLTVSLSSRALGVLQAVAAAPLSSSPNSHKTRCWAEARHAGSAELDVANDSIVRLERREAAAQNLVRWPWAADDTFGNFDACAQLQGTDDSPARPSSPEPYRCMAAPSRWMSHGRSNSLATTRLSTLSGSVMLPSPRIDRPVWLPPPARGDRLQPRFQRRAPKSDALPMPRSSSIGAGTESCIRFDVSRFTRDSIVVGSGSPRIRQDGLGLQCLFDRSSADASFSLDLTAVTDTAGNIEESDSFMAEEASTSVLKNFDLVPIGCEEPQPGVCGETPFRMASFGKCPLPSPCQVPARHRPSQQAEPIVDIKFAQNIRDDGDDSMPSLGWTVSVRVDGTNTILQGRAAVDELIADWHQRHIQKAADSKPNGGESRFKPRPFMLTATPDIASLASQSLSPGLPSSLTSPCMSTLSSDSSFYKTAQRPRWTANTSQLAVTPHNRPPFGALAGRREVADRLGAHMAGRNHDDALTRCLLPASQSETRFSPLLAQRRGGRQYDVGQRKPFGAGTSSGGGGNILPLAVEAYGALRDGSKF